jgi:hypothetical protein
MEMVVTTAVEEDQTAIPAQLGHVGATALMYSSTFCLRLIFSKRLRTQGGVLQGHFSESSM